MVIDPEHSPILLPVKTASSLLDQKQSARFKVSLALDRLARLAFGLMVITIPWRQRIVLQTRPRPPLYADFTDLLLFTHDIFLLLLVLLWGASLVARPRRLATGSFFIWWPLLGLTAMVGLSVITAVDPPPAAAHAIQVVLLAALFLYAANELEQPGVLMWALAIQIALQVTVGLAQAWQQRELGLAWFGEHALDPAGSRATVWAEGGLVSLRAYGLADHPNILAAGLVFAILLLAAWVVSSHSRWWPAGVALVAFAGVALFLTFTRPAWMALAAGTLVAMTLFWRAGERACLRRWGVLIGVTLLFLLPAVWRHLPYLRLGTSEAAITARVEERLYQRMERETLNRTTNQLFIHHALAGVGIGTLPVAMQRQTPDFLFDYQPPRVTMLAVAAEIGLIGAMFYFVLHLAPWLAIAWRRERLAVSPLLVGLSGALAAVTLFNVFDAYGWFYPSGRLWQWLIWGLWAAAYRKAGLSLKSTLPESGASHAGGATHA